MSKVSIANDPHRMEWAGLGWDGPPDEALVFGMGGGSKANSTPAGR